ncbi:SpoIIE family protein phosphatase [Streptomyces niger]|uniref:SpoIIE family protein phosphatase n=1 Tax=Streptomyces niger TaxID=66373 RepID=UPI00069AA755|nr:SpoIIE family protein phosphatase [Streptomyces niger]
MAEPGAQSSAMSPPEEWPAPPHLILALNGMGGFDWDLERGRLHMDAAALRIFDVGPDEYDGRPASLSHRVPPAEAARLDSLVAQAIKDGSESYGAYFRVRHHDGTLLWIHTHGTIYRDDSGRPHRIVGIVRDARQELQLSRTAGPATAGDRRRGHTSVVERTTAALAHARSVRDVVAVLGDAQGLSRLGVENVILGLVEAGRIQLVSEGQAGSFVPEHRFTRVADEFPMSEVVRTLRPRFVRSRAEFASCYPRLWPHVQPLNIGSAAYLPLIAQARPIGVIGLFYREECEFSTHERSILVALGSSIAQSLARAMLFDQEHDLAEALQHAMLPRRIPGVPGARIAVRYRAARLGQDIGGDWYDVIQLPGGPPSGGGRVAVVIGDVQGHDTRAATLMGQLRIVLRAYAAEGHPPATVMARASAFLHELDPERFATCTYADIDLTTGALQVVRAGHVDPLVRHAEGICRRLPVVGGLPLGLSAEFGQLDYPVTTVRLAPGETLVLCTDGLVERPGHDLDDGMARLARAVRTGPQDVQQLADLLCTLSLSGDGEDDMALLLLRRSGTTPPDHHGTVRRHVVPGDAGGLAGARRAIREAVRAWGAHERAEEIELVADELITNALLHTDGAAQVSLALPRNGERRLRLEVADRSSVLPHREEPADSRVHGRGLLLVDRLADVWGVTPRGNGKSVWCEFLCP